MREPDGGFAITSTVWSGRRLGQGTALIDEEVLRILLTDSTGGDKSLQLRYESIAGVALSDGSVVITCRDGQTLKVVTRQANAFRGTVLAACRALPEVTRALRALGSRRARGGVRRNPGDREATFFAPLIAARRRSMEAQDAVAVVAAFDAAALAKAVGDVIVSFAAELGQDHPARRRAFEAELTDATEELSAALERLIELAERAMADVDDLGRWRGWASGVRDVFEAADRSWVVIERIVSVA
jgi:hypothetical protein